jgi:hypothetical protein
MTVRVTPGSFEARCRDHGIVDVTTATRGNGATSP